MGAILALLSCFTVYLSCTDHAVVTRARSQQNIAWLQKSYRKSMLSYSLYSSSNVCFLASQSHHGPYPGTTLGFCLPSVAWTVVPIHSNSRHTAVIPLQTTCQAWIHPRLGTASPSVVPNSGDSITFKHQQGTEDSSRSDCSLLQSKTLLYLHPFLGWGSLSLLGPPMHHMLVPACLPTQLKSRHP